jgi:hypothetical protein
VTIRKGHNGFYLHGTEPIVTYDFVRGFLGREPNKVQIRVSPLPLDNSLAVRRLGDYMQYVSRTFKTNEGCFKGNYPRLATPSLLEFLYSNTDVYYIRVEE